MRLYTGRELSLASLLGLFALASLLPLVLLGAYGLQRYFAQQYVENLALLSGHAESLAQSVDRELRGYIDIAEVLAKSRALEAGNIAAFEELVRDAAAKDEDPDAGNFVLLDRTGQQLVNTWAAIGKPLPVTANPVALRRVVDTGRAFVGDLEFGAVAEQLLFAAWVPVMIGGKVAYVLLFAPPQHVVADILNAPDRPALWNSAIVDGEGRIVGARPSQGEFGDSFHWDALRRADGRAENGLLEAKDRDGLPSIAAFQPTTLSNWHVFVWVPKEVLEAPGRAALWLVLATLALTLIVSAAAALVVGRAIQGPNRRVLDAARALGEGKPISFEPTLMREANVVGAALVEAAREIETREKALRESEQHTRFIMRELSHRSKNLLAVVQAMARQADRSSSTKAEFHERFGARLSGLARSHDLLVDKNWEGVRLSDLIKSHVAAFVGAPDHPIEMTGPAVILRPDAAQNIGMALHELATNASKYGALSVPSGRIRISWEDYRDESGTARIRIRWEEHGGPPVSPPSRSGFGRAITEMIVPKSLGGRAQFDWKPEGLVWTLDIPADGAVSVAAGGSRSS